MVHTVDCRGAKSLIRTVPMTNTMISTRFCPRASGGTSTLDRSARRTPMVFLLVHDHKRLPGRFFARLRHSDGFL